MRWIGGSLVLVLLGCGPGLAGDDEIETETGDTTGELDEVCAAALDPAIFADGPIVSPEPWIATPECPALTSPMTIALGLVDVTGMVLAEGIAWSGYVEFHGRDGEGRVTTSSDPQAGFAVELLPGRYDVHAALEGLSVRHTKMVLEDVELLESGMLELDLPTPIQLTGSMTMDGLPAPDPFGYIHVVSTTTNPGGAVLAMQAGDFALTLSPGEYRFIYRWCDRDAALCFDCSSICDGFEGPPIPEDEPRIGPEQDWAPFHVATLGQSGVLDLDVSTARVDGTITLDGQAPPESSVRSILLKAEGGFGELSLADDGSFDSRIVRGTYETELWSQGGSLPELAEIDEDIHVEIDRQSVVLSALDPAGSPIFFSTPNGVAEVYAWRPDLPWQDTLLDWIDDERLDPPLWPGTWNLALDLSLCWPDLDGGAASIRVPIAFELELHAATDLGAIRPEFAAVHVDLVDLGDETSILLELQPGLADDGVTSGPTFSAYGDIEPDFDMHGYVIPGPYRVVYGGSLLGKVELEQGATLFARPRSQVIEASWTIDGVPAGDAGTGSQLYMRNLDTSYERTYHDVVEDGPNVLPPGRYELVYSGLAYHDDGLPDNQLVTMGCLTVEG